MPHCLAAESDAGETVMLSSSLCHREPEKERRGFDIMEGSGCVSALSSGRPDQQVGWTA